MSRAADRYFREQHRWLTDNLLWVLAELDNATFHEGHGLLWCDLFPERPELREWYETIKRNADLLPSKPCETEGAD